MRQRQMVAVSVRFLTNGFVKMIKIRTIDITVNIARNRVKRIHNIFGVLLKVASYWSKRGWQRRA